MEDKKILFKAKCIDNKDTDYEIGEIYNYIKNKGMEIVKDIYVMTGCTTFESFNNKSEAIWELIEEQTLLDKFYDLLGVEDMEEFKVEGVGNILFRFDNGILYSFVSDYWQFSGITDIGNILNGIYKIIKLPPKPIFSEEEKEQLKHIYGLFGECWALRNDMSSLLLYKSIPKKLHCHSIGIPNNYICVLSQDIIPSIKWEDTEPFKVDKQLIDSL